MAEKMTWAGVMPAITTPFRGDPSPDPSPDSSTDQAVDQAFLARHAEWLVENGVAGIVPLGSLGEGNTLTGDEKRAIVKTCVGMVGKRVPIVPGIAALATAEAVALAKDCEQLGCRGLMVLPPYVYKGSWRETRAHFDAVITATDLPCMLYNNPVAYGTDVVPEQVWELARDHDNLHAVKDSSGDVKRITAMRALAGDRLALFCGFDDVVLESVQAGAVGWIAGLVNALPVESVKLFELCELARQGAPGKHDEAFALYRWFLPLLRMDTVPDFVQRIKLVQQAVGMGTEAVRPPRLPLVLAERKECLAVIREVLENNPLA
jgi:4-hydroxy-tetrahydrodipicolinate synthase